MPLVQVANPLLKLYAAAIFLFIAQTVYSSLATIDSNVVGIQFAARTLTPGGEIASTVEMQLSLVLIFVVPPPILAILTYYKLYSPLKQQSLTVGRRKWGLTLSVLGIFYGLIVGGLLLMSAYEKTGSGIEKSGNQ
jgi:hypothetical protein